MGSAVWRGRRNPLRTFRGVPGTGNQDFSFQLDSESKIKLRGKRTAAAEYEKELKRRRGWGKSLSHEL